MKKNVLGKYVASFLGCLVLVLVGMVSQGWALPFNPATDASAQQLDALQSSFSDFGSSIDVYNEEKGAELFNLTSPIASSWFLEYNYSGSDAVEFGLYDPTSDLSNLSDADILVLFDTELGDTVGQVSVTLDAFGVYSSYNGNIFDSANRFGTFGFYVKRGNSYFFSESDNNNGGTDYFLTYSGHIGDTITGSVFGNTQSYSDDPAHWYITAEIDDGTPFDFNDIIVRTESMAPVPEPATILLFGVGLLGLAGTMRRKIKKS